jgi:hypothetical protein
MIKRIGKYKVLVDVAVDWEEDLATLEFVQIARNASEARDIVSDEIEKGKYDEDIDGRKYEILEASESDRICDLVWRGKHETR